jgi:hypothetical protein
MSAAIFRQMPPIGKLNLEERLAAARSSGPGNQGCCPGLSSNNPIA